MIPTFVHMCQFDIYFYKCVNRVSTFEKLSQLGPFKKKLLIPLILFVNFTTNFNININILFYKSF